MDIAIFEKYFETGAELVFIGPQTGSNNWSL